MTKYTNKNQTDMNTDFCASTEAPEPESPDEEEV